MGCRVAQAGELRKGDWVMMVNWRLLESAEERAKRLADAEAFFALPEDEFWRRLLDCEEDLSPNRRGGAHRWFRSENVVDLGKIWRERAKAAGKS
jgi:hypothetical protein